MLAAVPSSPPRLWLQDPVNFGAMDLQSLKKVGGKAYALLALAQLPPPPFNITSPAKTPGRI